VENFDLQLNETNPGLVVEGTINNKPGPYYVRLTLSNAGEITSSGAVYPFTENATPVMDAIVIVSDDERHVDTLNVIDFDESEYTWEYGTGYFKLNWDENGNFLDTSYISDDLISCNKRGYYTTSSLIGSVGHTYTLEVFWGGDKYEASAYMEPVPEVDSVGYLKRTSEKDGQEYYVPLLSFKEPQDTVNYYLILLHQDSYYRSATGYSPSWDISILSDTYLEPYVDKLNVNLGYNPRGVEYPFMYSPGDSIYLSLNSLTSDSYDFYKVLVDQFDNDGGAYKPAPSSPPGNISNGALGLFRASAVSDGRILIPFNDN
jgi:hypothetical protein